MTTPYQGDDDYPESFALPSGSDLFKVQHLNVPPEALADRLTATRRAIVTDFDWTDLGGGANDGNAVAWYGKFGVWVVAGGDDKAHYSIDGGKTWTAVGYASPQGIDIHAVASDGSMLNLAGDDLDYYQTSTDLSSLSTASFGGGMPVAMGIWGMVYDNLNTGLWVAVGSENKLGGADPLILISGDGSAWTSQTIPSIGSAEHIEMVAFSDERLVVYSRSGALWTSEAGAVWDKQSFAVASCKGLAWSAVDDLWMLVAGDGKVYTSATGFSWSEVAALSAGFDGGNTGQGRNCLATYGRFWLASLFDGVSNKHVYSIDQGVTWRHYFPPRPFVGEGLRSIASGDGRFLAAGADHVRYGRRFAADGVFP